MFIELGKRFNSGKMTEDEILEAHGIIQPFEAAKGKHTYFPNEKERKFFLQPHRVRFISGGNRSGKTCSCVIDVVSSAEGWHPMQKPNLEILIDRAVDDWVKRQCEYLLENKLWINSPPVDIRCVARDFTTYVEEILGPEVEKWATQADIKSFDYANEKKRKISWKNKSKLMFMTHVQDSKTHGGSALDLVWMDEEPPSQHFQESVMRIISKKGKIIGGMTAEDGVTWTEQKIFIPAEKGDSKYYAIEMSTYENPINTKEVIDEVLSMCLSEADVQIKIYGKRVPRGGHIFEQWKEAHPFLIERFQIPQEGGMLGRIIDPHPQLPHAVSWIWIDINHITNTDSFEKATGFRYPPFNNLPYMFVCAELFEKGSATMLASYIDIMEDKIGRKADITICDPRGWQISQEDENAKSLVEQLNDVGIYPIKGSKKLMGSEKNVGGLVKLKECVSLEFKVAKNMSGTMETVTKNFPQLMIFSDLNHHRFEYANYRWQPPPMTRAGESKEAPQKPIDKDDHFIENDRRFVEWARDQQFVIFDTPEYDAKLRYKSGDVEIEVNFEEEENMLIGA
jgi:hypothetical protein